VKPTEPSEAEQRAEKDGLAQLLKRAEAGDRSVLPQLQWALDSNPDLWRGYGDLAAHAEASLAMLAAGPDLLLAESLKRKLAELKAELGITANNLWTLLHRARVRLWQCLDRQGLGPLAAGGKP
jgi:hypothetical protein